MTSPPSLAPPSQAPPVPIPLGVPGLQPPAALQPGDTALLNPITDALAGVEGPLPLR